MSPQHPPLGRHYRVHGRQLMLDRAGEGTPGVVFLPGAGLTGLDYWNLHRRLAEHTTSVLYDRGGTGWSEAGNWPRTAAQVADELAELLDTAAIPAPYVLVGHSLGGAYARRFAQRHPELVAGLVLLEPLHEDWDRIMPEPLRLSAQAPASESMPEFTAELVEHFRGIFARAFAEWPDELREPAVARHLDPALLLRGMEENRTALAVTGELRDGGPVPGVPLVVVTALGIDPGQALFLSEEELAAQNDAKLRLYGEVAAPGKHVVLDSGGHSSLHTDRPDDVTRAILDVLAAARERQ
ncbi:alpha/beta fold hydrolase [Amycolatopsis sp. NPDC059021]|uniref:alpha/beta fold hydrolase n=1 Tax=Amycolatopsis sp. NPDC059021 TaxID=3346704 RepID=UPI0036718213